MMKSVKPEDLSHMMVNVFLRDGTEYLGCDLTNNMNERVCSFYKNNVFYTIPLDLIKRVEMYSNKP